MVKHQRIFVTIKTTSNVKQRFKSSTAPPCRSLVTSLINSVAGKDVCNILQFSIQFILNPQEATLSPKGMKLDAIVPHSLKGYFKSREELDEYEKTWHLFIYQPTWNELKSKVNYVAPHANNIFVIPVC